VVLRDEKTPSTLATQVIGPGGAQHRVEDQRTHELLQQLISAGPAKTKTYAGTLVGNSYSSPTTASPFTIAGRLNLPYTNLVFRPIRTGVSWSRPKVTLSSVVLTDAVITSEDYYEDGQVLFLDAKDTVSGKTYELLGVGTIAGATAQTAPNVTVAGRSVQAGHSDGLQTVQNGVRMYVVRRLWR